MSRKRMLLSLDQELHGLLMELSKMSGVPAATFVTGLLEQAKPQIIHLIHTYAVARSHTSLSVRTVLLTQLTSDSPPF